jgi:hypothetical protein
VGPPGKGYPRLFRQAPEPEDNKPGQYLGFPSIGVAKSQDTAAVPPERPFKGAEKMALSPQNHPGYAENEKKIDSAKNFYQQDDKF